MVAVIGGVKPSHVQTTLNILDAAATVLNSKTLGNAVGHSQKLATRLKGTTSAITAWSAQTTILSRVFIDESVLNEPIIPNLMRTIHEWYAAQIIAALQLTQMVDSFRTVQDVLSVVQTGYNERFRSPLSNIVSKISARESFFENYQEIMEDTNPLGLEDYRRDAKVRQGSTVLKDKMSQSDSSKVDDKSSASVRSVTGSDNRIGPMGELFELKLSNPNGNGQSLVVPIYIQMQPSIVPETIAPRFIDLNTPPSQWQRWTQMRAGELSFWKDFVFQADMIKRQKAIIKDPEKAKAFDAFLKTTAVKDRYALGDLTDNVTSSQSSNLANSVMIFSEEAVARAKADSGVDLHNEKQRQNYFKNTYCMILVVVDTLHQRVTIYFNGLDGELNSSYTEFRPKDQKFDPKEFMTALQAFSTNNINRMR